jgi:hypothetical protein
MNGNRVDMSDVADAPLRKLGGRVVPRYESDYEGSWHEVARFVGSCYPGNAEYRVGFLDAPDGPPASLTVTVYSVSPFGRRDPDTNQHTTDWFLGAYVFDGVYGAPEGDDPGVFGKVLAALAADTTDGWRP